MMDYRPGDRVTGVGGIPGRRNLTRAARPRVERLHYVRLHPCRNCATIAHRRTRCGSRAGRLRIMRLHGASRGNSQGGVARTPCANTSQCSDVSDNLSLNGKKWQEGASLKAGAGLSR